MPNRRIVGVAVAAAALVGLLAGCSSGVQGSAQALAGSIEAAVGSAEALPTEPSESSESAAESSASSAATAKRSVAEPEPVTRDLQKTGWWGGFAITVDTVTAEQGFGDGVDVTIELTYENLGTEPVYAPVPTVEIDGAVVESFLDNTPEVPGGGRTGATLSVSVPSGQGAATSFDPAIDAVRLVLGDAGDNQTVIPLAADAPVDSIEPQELAVTGTLGQGEIVVDVVSGSLAPSYESGEKGTSLLDLRITVSCAPGCSPYGYNVDRSQFSLTAPDGTSIAPDDRSWYCCDAIYPDTISDDEHNELTFLVDAPGTGAYTLTFADPAQVSAGAAPGTFAFTA